VKQLNWDEGSVRWHLSLWDDATSDSRGANLPTLDEAKRTAEERAAIA
jgi:hypothetical protein